MDTHEQPNSICHVQSIHMYPLQPSNIKDVPFKLLDGETVLHSGHSVDGVVLVTSYRLYLQSRNRPSHIPISLIEVVEVRELFNLHIGCKDARTYRCTFENNEKCQIWYDRILKAAEPPRQLEQLFAFYHCIWSKENGGEEVVMRLQNQRQYTFDRRLFEAEMFRLGFQGHSWRISKVNENYKFCPTYPPYLLVPSCINDDMLDSVAKFRSSRRIPAVVWRHSRNGAVIVRSSQPEVGWLGWRSAEDEDLIKAISEACNFDRSYKQSDKESNLSTSPGSFNSDESLQITNNVEVSEKKFLIMDARSYTTAVANRARGGGCECPEYYPNCEIQFMNLANIHSIRKSFHALRQLCTYSADQANWYSQLEGTRWLSHMSGLMKAAVTLVAAVERDARPVLVHCSDGWDRTPQIVALAELLLDPYYRTIDGFRILIEREWLAFGHKFADRCGHSSGSDDQNERCPVFLQWLDCVHQLLNQFPCAFEFSQIYLVKMVQHVYSNLFGTFLCNTQRERSKLVYSKTFSIWDFLNSPCFRNHLYSTNPSTYNNRRVLWPQSNVSYLLLWSEVYLGSIEDDLNPDENSHIYIDTRDSSPNYMTKTRSYGDLINDGENGGYHHRRSSDPSIKCEPKLSGLGTGEPTLNGHSVLLDTEQQNFLSNCLEDGDCSQDCMFNGDSSSTTDDQIGELEQNDFGDPPPLENEPCRNLSKEDNTEFCCNSEISRDYPKPSPPLTRYSNGPEGNCNGVILSEMGNISGDMHGVFLNEKTVENGDINHNNSGNRDTDECSKDNNGTFKETSECDNANGVNVADVVGAFLDMERSNETSTETLVGEDGTCQNSCNGNIKQDKETSKFSDSSTHATVGSNCWDSSMHNLTQQKNIYSYQNTLGDDGLVILRSAVQERLNQIIEDNNRKVELLEKELHLTRQNLIKQSRLRCNHVDCDRQEDTNSVIESVCSTSEGQASAAGESLRSDLSWVAVEEGCTTDGPRTLWVPDHAVSRCTGCSTEFWLGRRRHHCRKCGRIFCADCSENSTPLPSEHLYNPVRVCIKCYTELQRECTELPNQCKHANSQPTSANTQIAASSN